MPQELKYLETRLVQSRDLELLANDISMRIAHREIGDKLEAEIAARKLAVNSEGPGKASSSC